MPTLGRRSVLSTHPSAGKSFGVARRCTATHLALWCATVLSRRSRRGAAPAGRRRRAPLHAPRGSRHARAPTRPRRRGRSVETLREERADDACEHVARSRGGERRRPGVAHDDCSTRRGDDRVCTLEEHRRPEPVRRGPGCLQAVLVDPGGVGVEQARQLTGMRSEDRRGVALDGLEAEERVGVDDGREIDTRQQLANEGASGIRAPEAGPDRERRRPLARPPSARPQHRRPTTAASRAPAPGSPRPGATPRVRPR